MNKWRISYPLLFVAAFLLTADRDGYLLLILAAAAVHEGGHLLAIRMAGASVERVQAGLLGMKITYHARRQLSYGTDAWLALAGPLFNFLTITACLVLLRFFHDENIYYFIGVNLIFGLFNLIPAGPLDGGRALNAILCRNLGVDRGEQVMRVLTQVIGVLMALLGLLILWITGFNASLFLIAMVILLGICDKTALQTGKSRI